MDTITIQNSLELNQELSKDNAEMQMYFAAIQMIDAAILIWNKFPELLKRQDVFTLINIACDIKSLFNSQGGR